MARREAIERDNPSVDGADAAPAGSVPWPLVITAAYAWRFIAIGVLVAFGFLVFARLAPVLLPLIIAVLIAAPLERLVTRMARHRVPRGLGSAIVILTLFFVVVGLIAIAGTAIVAGFDELRTAALEGLDTFIQWLITGPLHVAEERLTNLTGQATEWLEQNWMGVANGALSVTGTIGQVLAGMLIALIGLFFVLRDGRGMWLGFVNGIGGNNASRIDSAGRNSWIMLRRYTQTSAFVAFVDAVGIGLAAWILGIPLAFPIAITVFLFSFIPMFGAAISGAVAVAVALVDGGWTTALIMLGCVLLVQQLEGSILYPLLFGKAASIHPMIILVSVSAGTLLAGFLGAVIAVPIVAATIAFVQGLRKEFVVEEPPTISQQLPGLRTRARSVLHRRERTVPDEPDRLVGD
jgi:predicted PurR-regulated permease PerM